MQTVSFKSRGRKSFKVEFVKADDGTPTGVGRAVFAVFGKRDDEGDIFRKGAFAASTGRRIAMLSQHGPAGGGSAVPIGIGTISEEGEKAIYDFELNPKHLDAEAWHWYLSKAGEDGTYSFGFSGAKGQLSPTNNNPFARDIRTADVGEVSAALGAIQPEARTLFIKAGDTPADPPADTPADTPTDPPADTPVDTPAPAVTMEQFNALLEKVNGLSGLTEQLATMTTSVATMTQSIETLQGRLPEPDTSIAISI